MAETSVSLHNTSHFYVREVFEEDLQMTRDRLQNEATKEVAKELDNSATVEENRGSGNSISAKTRNITAYEPHSKASRFDESFAMTQAEKVAVLDSLGMNCENTVNPNTDLECSGFIKAEDVQDSEVTQVVIYPGYQTLSKRKFPLERIFLLDCVHTMPAHFENGEKFDGSRI